MGATEPEILAAGGVVWRRGDDGRPEFAVIYRPKYDDWSLPKGKLDAGETFEQAALREVHEEIGARCTLGEELPPTTYRDHKKRLKLVRYWLMAVDQVDFEPNDEVDELRWLTIADAVPLLSYERDRALLDHAAGML